jgi:aldose 1-epimerase
MMPAEPVPLPTATVLAAEAPTAPSGRQFHLGHGDQRAVVTEVGASLRHYSVGGVDVVDGYAEHELCPSARGQVLAPWPNRLGDGRYEWGGRSGRAALDEPERRNAIHGLVRWMAWTATSLAQNMVVLACRLHPQPAYPWHLDLQLAYRLGRHGLDVTVTARNPNAEEPVPVAIGFHPYLTVGTTPVDRAHLQLPARRRLVTDERGLPTADASVAGTEYDFLAGRTIGPTRLDTAYTDLVRDGQGRSTVVLRGPDEGRCVSLWADGLFRYLMIFTADTVDPPRRRRCSVAVEPMTSPPDALRSGTDLLVLEPGASVSGSWGIVAG